MKTTKLFAAALAALGLAATASATPTTVYISGAPAVRQSATVAIEHLLIANSASHGGTGTIGRAYNGSQILTANEVIWTGGYIGSTPVTIKLAYTGSNAGWQAVAAGISVRFLPDSALPAAGASNSGQTDVSPPTDTHTADVHIPDFTFADEFQSSTPWIGSNTLASGTTVTGGANYTVPETYATLTDDIVGILPYRIVASPGTPFSNITPQLAQQVWINGGLNLSQFTGNASDHNSLVYGLGRDIGSGARTVWLSESGIGTNTTIDQFIVTLNTLSQSLAKIVPFAGGSGYTSAPTVSLSGGGGSGATATATVSGGAVTAYTVVTAGSGYTAAPTLSLTGGGGTGAYGTPVLTGGSISSFTDYPGGTLIGVTYDTGNGGYATFGPELSALSATPPSGAYFIAAVADADAQTAIAGGAKEIAWNGVFLGTLGTYGNTGSIPNANTPAGSGTASPALANGQYSLWSYIRIASKSTLAGDALATKNAIKTQLHDFDAQVLLKDVNVKRVAPDGGQVIQGQQP
jgi:hypothetical protein